MKENSSLGELFLTAVAVGFIMGTASQLGADVYLAIKDKFF